MALIFRGATCWSLRRAFRFTWSTLLENGVCENINGATLDTIVPEKNKPYRCLVSIDNFSFTSNVTYYQDSDVIHFGDLFYDATIYSGGKFKSRAKGKITDIRSDRLINRFKIRIKV